MDPLLFLCNLHAEGPRTLRLLERSGVRTPAGVLALSVERLAELLGGSPAAARRFQREATFAAQRAPQRDAEEHVGAATLLPDFAARENATNAMATCSDVDVSERTPRRARAARAASSRVTRTPRTDLRTTVRAGVPSASGTPAPRQSAASARAAQPGDLVRPGLLPGLDVQTCEQLVAAGLRTLEQLARVPPERLAPAIGRQTACVRELCAHAAAAIGAPHATAPDAVERALEAVLDTGVERTVELAPTPRRALPTPIGSAREHEIAEVAGPFASELEIDSDRDWASARES